MFEPSRLTLARKRRGLRKKELAAKVGVSERSVTSWEGDDVPTDANLEALAQATQFPLSFFHRPAIDLTEAKHASFRSLRSMRAFQRDQALAAGDIGLEVRHWLAEHYDLPTPDVPDLAEMEPEEAAAQLREIWGLGYEPIGNIVELMESHGVAVFSLVMDCREVDAFSVTRSGSTPLVLLNCMKSIERSRFDAAHELGHLVLHQNLPDLNVANVEKEANRFASAFLMPAADILACFRSGMAFGLDDLVAMKKNWNVSVAALARRLADLEIVSRSVYETLCIYMQRMGYRTNEPSPLLVRDTSPLLQDAIAMLREQRQGISRIAKDLSLQVGDVRDLFVHLAPSVSVLSGDGESSARSSRPTFRVLKGGVD